MSVHKSLTNTSNSCFTCVCVQIRPWKRCPSDQVSPSGFTLLSCSDAQLCVASAKPGANGQISAMYTYWDAPLQGNVKFRDVCCKVYELDLSENESLMPFDLKQTFAACPNLLRLNLKNCGNVLSDLDGLYAIAANCSKLRVLNLMGICQVESVETLWRILARMSNLKVLSLSAELLLQQGLDIPVPELSTIHIDGETGIDENLIFLACLTSLKVFCLDGCCELQQVSLRQLLHAYSKLTHLSLETAGRLVLPANSPCYNTL